MLHAVFHQIIVAAAGYTAGPDALCLLATLAAGDARVILADAGPPMEPIVAAAYEAALREDARAILARHRPENGVRVRVQSVGDRSLAVWDLARRMRADLVVVGAARPGAGASRSLRHAMLRPHGCCVAIAPHGYATAAHSTEPVLIASSS
jgi:nucleotide-binding universal stress UspA family protein